MRVMEVTRRGPEAAKLRAGLASACVGLSLLIAPAQRLVEAAPARRVGAERAGAHEARALDSRGERPMISFSGYQRLPGGRGRLFIHMSAKPELEVLEARGRERRFRLVDTDIGVRNNQHPLDLREFDELLLRSQLRPRGDDVVLELDLRRPAELTHEFVELEDGRISLQIDLPAR